MVADTIFNPTVVKAASKFLRFRAAKEEETPYKTKADAALKNLESQYDSKELENPDKVLLMDGWNKILGWETMWKEALWFRWRHIVTREDELSTKIDLTFDQANEKAHNLVERNKDPIAIAFGDRKCDGKNLLLALFDDEVRKLCPRHQVVQREAYRHVTDDRGAAFGMTLECKNSNEIIRLFSTLGLSPKHYVLLCEAFLWTMRSHNPYIGEDDEEDLEKPKKESAYARFVANNIAKKAIQDGLAYRAKYQDRVYQEIIPHFWNWVKNQDESFGESFYTILLNDHPDLLDYFARADMDSLSGHIVHAIDLMVKGSTMVGEPKSQFRRVMAHLGQVHRELSIPTDAYPAIGMNYVKAISKFLEAYPEIAKKEKNWDVSKDDIKNGILDLYGHTMLFTFYPMMKEEMLIRRATQFFEQVAEELDWSGAQLAKRILAVQLEINTTGTYHHTSEEIEIGARIAWRNSVKCIGRISWNTLMVRDCRHVETAEGIIREIEKHLELATAGTNLQSVMTVFRPRKPNEEVGLRFWSDQLVRYACYTNEDGTTMGDLANKHLTNFLIDHNMWTPPEPKTQHDVLPVVFKIPGQKHPVVYQFDSKYVDEAEIVHPDFPEVAKLGHKWAAVPAINTFNMNLGGVEYGCVPFNGWFCSVEIVRDLMERYEGANEKWAAAIGVDTKANKMWKARVAHEIDVAVIHSFAKAGYTIVDPETVGEQFMVHCKRERASGRECPAQWSWIGGLTGPTNKTWHKEMRDFRKDPQFEYCAEIWSAFGFDEKQNREFDHEAEEKKADECEDFSIPRVLIAFGSETGTAEAAALRLARAMRVLKPMVVPLNNIAGLEDIKHQQVTHLLVLCSTFGKGGPPACAQRFVDTEISPGVLDETKFATLALGSTMYPEFCAAGKEVDRMLLLAGGQRLVPITLADEAVNSPGTVADWISTIKTMICPSSLESAVEEKMGMKSEPLHYELKWRLNEQLFETIPQFQWPCNTSTKCIMNEELVVGEGAKSRSTRRIGFEVADGATYTSGDHLCVSPLNSVDVVRRFAACFSYDFLKLDTRIGFTDLDDLVEFALQQEFQVYCIDNGDVYPAQLSFKTNCTLGEALQSRIGLTLLEGTVPDVVDVFKDYIDFECDNEVLCEFKLLSKTILGGRDKEAQDAVDKVLSVYPTVVHLLEAICPIVKEHRPTKQIPLAHVLAVMPKLQPRMYSISSSGIVSPQLVEISVGVVHCVTDDGVEIDGVCSNYLARLRPNIDRANISIRTSSFRGPKEPINTPTIMVGAGTGLAPMMGFLQDRAYAMQQGISVESNTNNHLFFGCRTHDERLYSEVIKEWESKGVLNLHLALSRDTSLPKQYVQHKLKEQGKLLCELLLQDNCHYYVCGDARMADLCYEAVIELLREHAPMSRSRAVLLLKRMRVEDRWQYDLWGISSYLDEGSYSDAKKKIALKNGNKALAWLAKMNRTDDDEW